MENMYKNNMWLVINIRLDDNWGIELSHNNTVLTGDVRQLEGSEIEKYIQERYNRHEIRIQKKGGDVWHSFMHYIAKCFPVEEIQLMHNFGQDYYTVNYLTDANRFGKEKRTDVYMWVLMPAFLRDKSKRRELENDVY